MAFSSLMEVLVSCMCLCGTSDHFQLFSMSYIIIQVLPPWIPKWHFSLSRDMKPQESFLQKEQQERSCTTVRVCSQLNTHTSLYLYSYTLLQHPGDLLAKLSTLIMQELPSESLCRVNIMFYIKCCVYYLESKLSKSCTSCWRTVFQVGLHMHMG